MATAEQLGLSVGDYVLAAVRISPKFHVDPYLLDKPPNISGDEEGDTVFDVLRVSGKVKGNLRAQIVDTTYERKDQRVGDTVVVSSAFPDFIDTILPRREKIEERMVEHFVRMGVDNIHMEVAPNRNKVVILQKGVTHNLQFH